MTRSVDTPNGQLSNQERLTVDAIVRARLAVIPVDNELTEYEVI